jgi:hypothetical protein
VKEKAMVNHALEVFGYFINDLSSEACWIRQKHWCPFTESTCDRTSLSIDYPLGICTVLHDRYVYAICPHRFEGSGTIEKIPLVLENILLHYFGSINNLVTFSNIKLPNHGTIDYVIAHHKPFKLEIDDFVAVEIRSFIPTSTVALIQSLKDIMAGKNLLDMAYHINIDVDRSIKRFLSQVLEKGIVYENWGIKSYWVIQEYIYANLVKRYGLKRDGYSEEHASRFALQELSLEDNQVKLQSTRYVSVSVDEVYQAMRNNPSLPKKDQFVATLNEKLKARLNLKFE